MIASSTKETPAAATKSPVLFLIFNRPEETARAFDAIRAAKPSRLYVNADGPRPHRPDDLELCKLARAVAQNVDWPCKVHYRFSDRNEGCRWSVTGALKWFFEAEAEGIILEDDLIADLSFFRYCDELLERYRHDDRVFSINGSNYGYVPTWPESYRFTMFMNMWGWAAWRRSYTIVDANMNDWSARHRLKLPLLYRWLRGSLLRLDWTKISWAVYWKERFDAVAAGKLSSWGYVWVHTALRHQKLCVTPSVNLLCNVGWGVRATHTVDADDERASIPSASIGFPLRHPGGNIQDHGFDGFAMTRWAQHDKVAVHSRRDLLKRFLRSLRRD